MSIHLALCAHDRCPWKHRGVTSEAAREAGVAHVRSAGHIVTLYEDDQARVFLQPEGVPSHSP